MACFLQTIPYDVLISIFLTQSVNTTAQKPPLTAHCFLKKLIFLLLYFKNFFKKGSQDASLYDYHTFLSPYLLLSNKFCALLQGHVCIPMSLPLITMYLLPFSLYLTNLSRSSCVPSPSINLPDWYHPNDLSSSLKYYYVNHIY